ncbi:MAG: hypothetical protein A2788_00190 [Candidatus Abawacabacteria bacterium RIFCSPHIGHO2_01_FULL_46_8]|uniref:DUF3006 domain-containing protein n=1 Tax=Candidatus Abawacabacteria bacterium RIFCSPHIGHO2_01_FULL_46_8 TaxID=1817815 RepID=A0A1F4XJX2_9BACT|nr:MAG: hypothetical protein A2788_00190 [Candidatus Abawacabacteria bacterium RIFCSPHIGHO2_01_FULL_46_8]
MSWLEAEKFALKAKLVELTADDALIFLPGLNNSLKWPRQQLPPSLKAGDEFWLQIVSAETRELAQASLRRDILSELMR